MAFSQGESPMLNSSQLVNPNNLHNSVNSGLNSAAAAAAAARSAKVKSDLLMGLNAGFRPERLSAMKESGYLNQQHQQQHHPSPGQPHPQQAHHQQQQQHMPATTLSQEHSNMLNSLNGICASSELPPDNRIK